MMRWIVGLACLMLLSFTRGEALWKCGDVFTDQPTARSGRPCLPASASSVVAAVPRAASASSRWDKRIEPAAQGARDREARVIVQAELSDTLARRAALLAAESSTPPAAFAAELHRLDSDIDSLRREVDRRPKDMQ